MLALAGVGFPSTSHEKALQSMAHDGLKTRYAAGDEIVFQHTGLLIGRVERVTCGGRKVRYEVIATLTFDVPEQAIVGRESEVIGDAEETGEQAKDRR